MFASRQSSIDSRQQTAPLALHGRSFQSNDSTIRELFARSPGYSRGVDKETGGAWPIMTKA